MPNEQDFTQVSPRALKSIAIAVLLGFICGYVARPHLQPQTAGAPEVIEAMTFTAEDGSTFPYTFQNRREAVEWLARHIAFLDRHVPSSAASRPDVEQMKIQLFEIQTKSMAKLPLPLFARVNSEVEKLQQTLSTAVVATPQSQPSEPQPSQPYVGGRIPRSID